MLSAADQATLRDLDRPYTLGNDEGFVTVAIEGFPMPAGIQPVAATLLYRLPPGFPDAAPDMFWLDPAVTGPSGAVIAGTEARQAFMGRTWQRWSRHIQGQWRPGIDNLATYIAYTRRCLDLAAGIAA